MYVAIYFANISQKSGPKKCQNAMPVHTGPFQVMVFSQIL